MGKLFCFGFGYTARALARVGLAAGWQVVGTVRSGSKAAPSSVDGVTLVPFAPKDPGPLLRALADSSHILLSIPPGEEGDPVGVAFRENLAALKGKMRWIGYLSTVGVYGDHGGGWVDETTPPRPRTRRSHWRLAAETEWLAFGDALDVPVQIFRLPGIYGPGRNALEALRAGRARRLVKPGQVFNRCHVSDIAQTLWAAMNRTPSRAGEIYNVVDDLPAPSQDVVAYAARLLGVPPPPEETFETARVSPITASFYGECKRVGNAKIKRDLGVQLAYPTYRDGLRAIWRSDFSPQS